MGSNAIVRGVLLDEALFFEANSGIPKLRTGVHKLMIRLKHSGLLLGILSTYSPASSKDLVLENLDVSKSFQFLFLEHEDPSKTVKNILKEWDMPGRSCLYVTTSEIPITEFFSSESWNILTVGSDNKTPLCVEQIDYLPSMIVSLTKKALGDECVVVGHSMNWSREHDFLKRGAMPILPTNCGLIFLPIMAELCLEKQLAFVDVLLNKATDEIVSVSSALTSTNIFDSIKFSEAFKCLEEFLASHQHIRVIDPTVSVIPLMDRVATQNLLQNLPKCGVTNVRPPHTLQVESFNSADLQMRLTSASVGLPAIVKPRIACGASESHTMAVVFEEEAYANLSVPLPAIIQEYVDHCSTLYKFYVIGDQVFHSVRKSTPNASILKAATRDRAIVFDSLKSLPLGEICADVEIDLDAIKVAASYLRSQLGLTIIGFDVVVKVKTKEHVIVDVNYFPSFKDISDEQAIPAFWKALHA